MASSWGDVLREQQQNRPANQTPDMGVLMASGLRTAGKCRECAKTIDVGTPAWFNKNGDPGRKITCQECHSQAAPSGEAAAEAETVQPRKRTVTKRKTIPKMSHEMLLDKDKGILAVFKHFPKIKFKRPKGNEAENLKKLINKYAEWAHNLLPDMEFGDFVTKLDKNFSGNMRVKSRVDFIRNVQQGLCAVEELDDYDLAERGAGLSYAETEDGTRVVVDEDGLEVPPPGSSFQRDAAPRATAQSSLTAEQRARVEQKRREALEKAARRRSEQESADVELDEADWHETAKPAAPQQPPVADDDEFPLPEDLLEEEMMGDFAADEEAADELLGSAAFDEMHARPAAASPAVDQSASELAAAAARAAAAAAAAAVEADDLDDLEVDELF